MEDNLKSILQFLANEMTAPERAAFFQWLEVDPANKQLYAEIKHLYTASEMAGAEPLANINDLYRSFKKQIAKPSPKVMTVRRMMRNLQRVAAILLLPVAGFSIWQMLATKAPDRTAAVELDVEYSYYTPRGVMGLVTLPDSTKVWLNSGTTIHLSKEFSANNRTVTLSGEAYFDVAKDTQHPFIVELPEGSRIHVYGTQFNVLCYPAENIIQTTLVEGSLGIESKMLKQKLQLKPNESLVMEVDKGKYVQQEKVDVELHTSWKDGRLIFRNTPAPEVFAKLSRWFNFDFEIQDASINNFHFTATFDRENVAQVMELLHFSSPIEYTITKEKVTIKQR